MTKLQYEVVRSRFYSGPRDDNWRVEAVDYEHDGIIYATIFLGPQVKERAREYTGWKKASNAGQ